MSNQHQLTISAKKYPGGLRVVECQQCNYTFAAEFDEHGIINLPTKVSINSGDPSASHSYFHTPEISLTLDFDSLAESIASSTKH